MIENFVLGVKLLKYGFKVKQNMLFMAAILVIGIAVEFVTEGTNIIGGFYILIVGMFMQQLIMSLNLSSLIQTSKIKKATQTSLPTIVSFILYLVMLTIISVEKYIFVMKRPDIAFDLKLTYLTVVVLFFFSLIYCGFSYKYYVSSILCFFIVVMVAVSISTMSSYSEDFFLNPVLNMSMGAIIAIGYVLFVAGILLQYAFSILTYKKEISPIAFKAMMKRMN